MTSRAVASAYSLHFLLGYSLGNAIDGRGLATAAFFALIFAAGHLTQEIRWSLKTLAEGLTFASICRLQARYRALYALIGLVMVAALYGAPGHLRSARGETLPAQESLLAGHGGFPAASLLSSAPSTR